MAEIENLTDIKLDKHYYLYPNNTSHTLSEKRSLPTYVLGQRVNTKIEVSLPTKSMQQWNVISQEKTPELVWATSKTIAEDTEYVATLAAINVFFNSDSKRSIEVKAPAQIIGALLKNKIAVEFEQKFIVDDQLFFQAQMPWLIEKPANLFPLEYSQKNGGNQYPKRPPQAKGTVYARYIPWLKQTLTFRVLDIDKDLERFNHWQNNPRVARFWQEEGCLEKHREYLKQQLADPHQTPLIGCFDGVPFAYFEVYWTAEDPIASFYCAKDFDQGWHMLVGENDFRGKAYFSAWCPSMMHYLFLRDTRTKTLVCEPRSDHKKIIGHLQKCGMQKIKEFDFPHKRAAFMQIDRNTFFSQKLWMPKSS